MVDLLLFLVFAFLKEMWIKVALFFSRMVRWGTRDAMTSLLHYSLYSLFKNIFIIFVTIVKGGVFLISFLAHLSFV